MCTCGNYDVTYIISNIGRFKFGDLLKSHQIKVLAKVSHLTIYVLRAHLINSYQNVR